MIELSAEVLEACKQEALRSYPSEGCGFLVGPKPGMADELVAVPNIQDKLHALDPVRFERTSKTAYSMDPRAQERIFRETETQGRLVTGIFHSHPDHDAYFSAEDKTNAAPWGEPLLPGLAYVVVSVYNESVKEAKQFYWSPEKKDFIEALL